MCSSCLHLLSCSLIFFSFYDRINVGFSICCTWRLLRQSYSASSRSWIQNFTRLHPHSLDAPSFSPSVSITQTLYPSPQYWFCVFTSLCYRIEVLHREIRNISHRDAFCEARCCKCSNRRMEICRALSSLYPDEHICCSCPALGRGSKLALYRSCHSVRAFFLSSCGLRLWSRIVFQYRYWSQSSSGY